MDTLGLRRGLAHRDVVAALRQCLDQLSQLLGLHLVFACQQVAQARLVQV